MSGVQGPSGPTNISPSGDSYYNSPTPISMAQVKQIANLIQTFSNTEDWGAKFCDFMQSLEAGPENYHIAPVLNDMQTQFGHIKEHRESWAAELIDLGGLLKLSPSTPITGQNRYGLFWIMQQGCAPDYSTPKEYLTGLHPTTPAAREALAQALSLADEPGKEAEFKQALAALMSAE